METDFRFPQSEPGQDFTLPASEGLSGKSTRLRFKKLAQKKPGKHETERTKPD